MTNNNALAMALRVDRIDEKIAQMYSILNEPDSRKDLNAISELVTSCANQVRKLSAELRGTPLTMPTASNVVAFRR